MTARHSMNSSKIGREFDQSTSVAQTGRRDDRDRSLRLHGFRFPVEERDGCRAVSKWRHHLHQRQAVLFGHMRRANFNRPAILCVRGDRNNLRHQVLFGISGLHRRHLHIGDLDPCTNADSDSYGHAIQYRHKLAPPSLRRIRQRTPQHERIPRPRRTHPPIRRRAPARQLPHQRLLREPVWRMEMGAKGTDFRRVTATATARAMPASPATAAVVE